MPFDAVFMSCLRKELEKKIIGNKIDKIQQPGRDLFILNTRSGKLLISLNSSSCRVQITDEVFENPASPPMFCMLLRKYLTGGRILSLSQPSFERVFDLEIETYDALGAKTVRHLIIELLGRYTNLILTDSDGIITDSVRRIGFEISDKRQVLSGLLYRLPPETGKMSPDIAQKNEIIRLIDNAGDIRLDKLLNLSFDGLSPLVCREIVYRAYGDTDVRASATDSRGGAELLADEFISLVSEIQNEYSRPYLISDKDGKPVDFSYTKISQYEEMMEVTEYGTFSELLTAFYSNRDKIERMRVRTQAISKNIRRLRDRTVRKVSAQKEELLMCSDREINRENGDLITSNIYRMQKGMTSLFAEDFFNTDGGIREIKLDPMKTPQQNAAKYYRDYTKAKTAETHLKEQIDKGESEIDYLDSVLESLERAENEKDVTEIRQELTDMGYIKSPKNSRKEKKIEQKPMRFISSSGIEILVGKNNTQNDHLTMKTALRHDIWLHTQRIHGSHVVVSSQNGEPDEQTIYEAAVIAAYYSKAKDSGNVPVDYTAVRNVKKPSGAKPGMVIYSDYSTLFVDPDEELVEKLRVK